MDYNDELSRKTIALSQVFKHIQSDIVEVVDYYNDKGVDCVGVDKNGNDVCYIEVECANYWKYQPYFRSFVSLPQRKRWYLSEEEWNKKLENSADLEILGEWPYGNLPFYYVTFNLPHNRCIITNRFNLLNNGYDCYAQRGDFPYENYRQTKIFNEIEII